MFLCLGKMMGRTLARDDVIGVVDRIRRKFKQELNTPIFHSLYIYIYAHTRNPTTSQLNAAT